jgi:hypothetical protein
MPAKSIVTVPTARINHRLFVVLAFIVKTSCLFLGVCILDHYSTNGSKCKEQKAIHRLKKTRRRLFCGVDRLLYSAHGYKDQNGHVTGAFP